MLTSLYIHIPFCNQICTYCDFNKEIAKNSKKEKYINALIQEIIHHKETYHSLETIYIGGGTPSSLNHVMLELLLKTIKEVIDLSKIKEFSIETNPNDIDEDFVLLIKKYGINRVSVGVQTFDENHLSFLNRSHKEEDIYNAVRCLKDGGINNISVDMIFSLVNQTLVELKNDVSKVISLDINHISYYSLILEEKTTLYYLYNKDKIEMNNEDLEEEMFRYIMEELEKSGYTQYEISNFSKNMPSLHNMAYWTNKEYLGLGSGAHSLVNNQRFYQTSNVGEYISKMNNQKFQIYDYYEYDNIVDEMMLGLRMMKGVSISYIEKKYDLVLLERYKELNDFIESNHLEIVDDYIRLTKKGIFIGNVIFQVFLEV